jgi:hypothetical protein
MRQLAVTILVTALLLLLAGCGGGSSSSSGSGVPASIAVSPSPMSLTLGEVSALTVTIDDSNGATVTVSTNTTFTSSNTAVATVSTTGNVCAGTWDANNIYCTPGQSGTATITVANGSLTTTVTVYTHPRVDRVTVTPAAVNCISTGGTQQMTAQAFSAGTDVTSLVGPFIWSTSNTAVTTLNTTGVATAVAPGAASVYASVSDVASVPVQFVTCPVQSIHVHLANTTDTTFTAPPTGTQQLAADVLDSAGKTISPGLTWYSTQPAVATVTSAGLVNAIAPGTASIVAECTGACNTGTYAVYSDVVVATVSGASASTVYVTGTAATSLVPIDTGTNAAGTVITLPSAPNSIVFAPNGTRAFLGSSGGAMVLDATTNTVTQTTTFPGRVLAVSPDGTRGLVADTSSVYSVGAAGASNETLAIAGANAAAFVPDGSFAYIVAGSTLYVYVPGTSLKSYTLAAAANDVEVLPTSAFVYFAGGAPTAVTARAVCNTYLADTQITPGTPSLLAATPDAAKILAVDSPGVDVLTRSSTAQPGCPPPLTESRLTVDFGQGAFTARQALLLPNGSKAYVTSNLAALLVYDPVAGATTTIPLAGGATPTTGGATLDSAKLYVGGSDNNVHLIDVASGADTKQIPVSFTPDLVAVRPK